MQTLQPLRKKDQKTEIFEYDQCVTITVLSLKLLLFLVSLNVAFSVNLFESTITNSNELAYP